MPRIKNAVQKAESMTGKINPHYDMSISNMKEIYRESIGVWDMIHYSFQFGYLQGMKAARAEMKKGGCGEWVGL